MSTASKPSLDEECDEQSGSHSLPEEYAAILEHGESDEEEEFTNAEEHLCSFFDHGHISKTTLDEFYREQLKDNPLFANVLILDNDDEQISVEKPSDDPDTSILVTGFGMRNLASLQDALRSKEKSRLLELYKSEKSAKKEKVNQYQSAPSMSVSSPKRESSKRSIETETDLSSASSDVSVQQEKVRYLMGLEAEICEEEAYPQEEDLIRHMFAKESEDKFVYAQTSTTKSAQTYLRTHRIFDFFQFIIAHILSAAPDNPITFILVLLNKILLYRAGTGNPPLLYEKKHIEQLFRLMDRMNSGYIDKKQYTSGMTTLGICQYNNDPKLSEENLVSKDVFVQEALEAETALFNDLIKRKWTDTKPKVQDTFSVITSHIRSYISGYNLIPADLLKSGKLKILSENEGG